MTASRPLILSLVREVSTLDEVRSFLKDRGLPYSAASWDRMIGDRLEVELDRETVLETDLIDLIREGEEFGRQHVFLFKNPTFVAVPSGESVRTWLTERGDIGVLDSPRVLDKPAEYTVSEVRWDEGALVVKAVETRRYRKLVAETEVDGLFTVQYRLEPARAVSVIRIAPTGRVEVRIYSHRSGPQRYGDDVTRALQVVAPLLDITQLEPISLLPAKARLWESRERLASKIRYSNAEFRDDFDNTARISAGDPSASLFDSDNAEESLIAFSRGGQAHCSAFNIWWIKDGGGAGLPSSDIHVLLSGAMNEFAVTTQCSRADYEYVLGELDGLNQGIS